jgi:periplasmic protein CpxP/Spy
MNTRLSSVIVAALALSLSAGFVAQTHAAPVSAGGQQYKLAQGRGQGQNRLNLTDAQKAQMRQIHEKYKPQMQSILTDEQKTQLQNAGADRNAQRKVWASLSQDQKNQMKTLRQQEEAEENAVLTPEQQQQKQQWQQQMRARHQQQQQQ